MLRKGLWRGKSHRPGTLLRECKQLEATGTEDVAPKFARGYLKKLLHGQHDSDREYIEKMQATIPSIEIRKKLAIRERISNI